MRERLGPRRTSTALLAAAAAVLVTATLTYISGGALCLWRRATDLTDPYADELDVAQPVSRIATSARSSGA